MDLQPSHPSRHKQHSPIRFLLSRHKPLALARVEKLKYGWDVVVQE